MPRGDGTGPVGMGSIAKPVPAAAAPGRRRYFWRRRPACATPGARIRSKGQGRGLGIGQGRGPIGRQGVAREWPERPGPTISEPALEPDAIEPDAIEPDAIEPDVPTPEPVICPHCGMDIQAVPDQANACDGPEAEMAGMEQPETMVRIELEPQPIDTQLDDETESILQHFSPDDIAQGMEDESEDMSMSDRW